jgi:hypothetical protein
MVSKAKVKLDGVFVAVKMGEKNKNNSKSILCIPP